VGYAGSVLTFLGRTDQALAQVAKAREFDPLAVLPPAAAALALLLGRRFEDATAAALQALELQPDNTLALSSLSLSCVGHSRPEEAVTHIAKIPA